MSSKLSRSIFYIAGFNSGGPALTPIRKLFETNYSQYKTLALSSSSTKHAWKQGDYLLSHVVKNRVEIIRTVSTGTNPLFLAHSLGCIELLRDIETLLLQDVFSGKMLDLVLMSPPNLFQSGKGVGRLTRMFTRFLHMQMNLAKFELLILEKNLLEKDKTRSPIINDSYFRYLNTFHANGFSKKISMNDFEEIISDLKESKITAKQFHKIEQQKKDMLTDFFLGLFEGKHVPLNEHKPFLVRHEEFNTALSSNFFFMVNYPFGFLSIMWLMKDIDKLLSRISYLAYERRAKLRLRFVFFESDVLVKISEMNSLTQIKNSLEKHTVMYDSLVFQPSSHSTVIYNTKILNEILNRYLV